jgi:hypothetical protein
MTTGRCNWLPSLLHVADGQPRAIRAGPLRRGELYGLPELNSLLSDSLLKNNKTRSETRKFGMPPTNSVLPPALPLRW